MSMPDNGVLNEAEEHEPTDDELEKELADDPRLKSLNESGSGDGTVPPSGTTVNAGGFPEGETPEGEEKIPGSAEADAEPIEEEHVPVFMQDAPPTDKNNLIKWALMHGMTEERLEEEGHNTTTIRLMALELEKSGFRKRPKKEPKLKELPSGRGITRPATGGAAKPVIHGLPKSTTPESILASFKIPDNATGMENFDAGVRYGVNSVIMGVRIAQELALIGTQQVKPLIEMTKEMRSGEAAAAESAASTSAAEASDQVLEAARGYFETVVQEVRDIKSSNKEVVKEIAEK